MTATDELRRLLDGRGVAWRAAYYSPENVTEFKVGGIRFRYIESSKYDDFCWIDTDRSITPQQAVDVTLGRGTCHITVEDNLAETEGMGDVWLECSACHWQMLLEPTTPLFGYCPPLFNYCPNCGRRVVDA